jgi:hypothetical protein
MADPADAGSTSSRCPACGSERVVPIVYGLPNHPDLFRRANLGEVVLGGCIVSENSPDQACMDCHARWRTKRPSSRDSG